MRRPGQNRSNTLGRPGALKVIEERGKSSASLYLFANQMPLKYSELDRKNAADGYTPENRDLVHAKCHQERQAAKGYA
jgi:hypothetical protein